MTTQNKGPASYFASIEKTYGRPVEDWFEDMQASGITKHEELVDWLKAGHGLGHGHANALVAYHLNPGKHPEYLREA